MQRDTTQRAGQRHRTLRSPGKLLVLASLLGTIGLIPVAHATTAASLINGLGGGAGFGTETLEPCDDCNSSAIDLTPIFGSMGVKFGSNWYTSAYINNNGMITFGDSFDGYAPNGLSEGIDVSDEESEDPPRYLPAIALYWTDLEATSAVTPSGAGTGENRVHWYVDSTNKRVIFTWNDVTEYDGATDTPVIAGQIILSAAGADNSGNMDIQLRYGHAVSMHISDDGESEPRTVVAGWNAGVSGGTSGIDYFEIPAKSGAASVTEVLDDLDTREGNTGLVGIWNFYLRNGGVAGKAISYSATTFTEAAANDGSISTTATLTLTGETFTGTNGDDWSALVSNVPAGLTAHLTRTSDTEATLSFTGTATAHANSNDIANLRVNFTNAYFSGGNAAAISNADKSDLSIDFNDPENTAPSVSNLSISGTRAAGSTLTASYTFTDAESDPDQSFLAWGTGTTADNCDAQIDTAPVRRLPGNSFASVGPHGSTHVVEQSEVGKYVCYAIYPHDGANRGTIAYSPAVLIPAAEPTTPTTPTNPFNPGGTNTSTEVNNNVGNNLGGGTVVTPATGSIISNLSEVNQTTGVSDNGVVVVTAPPGKTIKLVDNAPNGVLFSLPVQQAIPVQLQGRTVAITVNNEVVRGSDGKPLTAVLATRTVPTPSGGSQQVLEVVSGQGQFQASSANQLLGALTLSQGGTLRTVTIVDNSGNGGGTTIPGTAGFFKDPKDKSGSVSAENGAVVLNVMLTPEGASAGNRLAAETITKQITLQAGEVARFNAKGELIGVFAGSLSGTLGKTGDPVAVTAPAGLSAYPAKAVKLDGNTLDRLGSNLLPAFAAAIDGTSNFADEGTVTTTAASGSTLTQDAATGIVTAKYQSRADTLFQGLPVGNVTVDPATPDGIVWHTNGSVTWSRKGISVTFVPVSPALTDLAASAKQGGYTTQLLDNGVLKLTGNASYLVGLPRFAAIKEGKAAGFAWEAAEQRATFTDAQGYTQIIDPVPYDGSQLDTTVAGMPGWKMSREYFLYGTLRLTGPAGEQFLLTPDYAVTLGKDSVLAGSAYTGDDGRLHYGFTTGFLPFAQGFAVK